MKYLSLEIRWFAEGPVPEEWKEWFAAGDDLPEPGVRTDHYLLDTQEALNIKLREGRVEVKQRLGTSRRYQLNDHCGGWQEEWVKWSFGLDEAEDYVHAAAADPASWLAVGKKRYLRTFTLDEMGRLREADPERRLPAGCGVELTALMVGKHHWHTVGLEAFGEKNSRKRVFDAAARSLLTVREAPPLLLEQSLGYAAWISEFYPKMVGAGRVE